MSWEYTEDFGFNSPEKHIIVLVGNRGAGKTTHIRKAKYVENGYVIIARDRLRYAIGGGQYVFNPEWEQSIWATETFMLEKFLDLGVNIVVDEVGVSKLMREKYIRYAKKRGYICVCKEMPRLSKEISVDRRLQDPHGQHDRKLWESVWEKFNNQYEKPTLEEGFDYII
ncbi:MAG: AAA family ATPase [Promethearchaeota archaeon]